MVRMRDAIGLVRLAGVRNQQIPAVCEASHAVAVVILGRRRRRGRQEEFLAKGTVPCGPDARAEGLELDSERPVLGVLTSTVVDSVDGWVASDAEMGSV
jgi:hypothetical protein